MLALILACAAPEPADSGAPADAPTWHEDVAPVVVAKCGSCHTEGGTAPFTLDDFAGAGPMAAASLAAVEAGRMPPWDAETTEQCRPGVPFADDPRLTADEVALLRAWVDAGAPEGDPDAAAPLPEPPSFTLEDATARLTPSRPWTAEGDRDRFRCFSLDPQTDTDVWITGVQLVPGAEAVVHHALVFSDPTGASAELARGEGSYDCVDAGVPDSELLHTWTPGQVPLTTPEGVGIPLPAGSRVVVQIHYHPVPGVAVDDASTLELRWTEEAPDWDAYNTLIGNFSDQDVTGTGLQPGPNDPARGVEFRIPADVADHTETMRYRLDGSGYRIKLLAMGSHMHYVGTEERIVVEPAAGGDEACLLHTPTWDFEWQMMYRYDAPLEGLPELLPGDVIRVECAYDNTTANPGVLQMLEDEGLDAPVDVYLGEETTDEMCLAMVQFLVWPG